jgi:hypothetical protein
MNDNLGPALQPSGSPVAVQVTGQKHGLKENKAGVPDRGASTEHGKRHFGKHRFYQEQQSCADKHGNCKSDQQHWVELKKIMIFLDGFSVSITGGYRKVKD